MTVGNSERFFRHTNGKNRVQRSLQRSSLSGRTIGIPTRHFGDITREGFRIKTHVCFATRHEGGKVADPVFTGRLRVYFSACTRKRDNPPWLLLCCCSFLAMTMPAATCSVRCTVADRDLVQGCQCIGLSQVFIKPLLWALQRALAGPASQGAAYPAAHLQETLTIFSATYAVESL
ncbi:hypothetical protein [Limimonas halophila]|uniref:hypothetical protein n=1 Tax=Limimonas halophila TaxID=1082479 RepID=UPI00115FC652|nr:hypothetical protein [Limimonas halophila]